MQNCKLPYGQELRDAFVLISHLSTDPLHAPPQRKRPLSYRLTIIFPGTRSAYKLAEIKNDVEALLCYWSDTSAPDDSLVTPIGARCRQCQHRFWEARPGCEQFSYLCEHPSEGNPWTFRCHPEFVAFQRNASHRNRPARPALCIRPGEFVRLNFNCRTEKRALKHFARRSASSKNPDLLGADFSPGMELPARASTGLPRCGDRVGHLGAGHHHPVSKQAKTAMSASAASAKCFQSECARLASISTKFSSNVAARAP